MPHRSSFSSALLSPPRANSRRRFLGLGLCSSALLLAGLAGCNTPAGTSSTSSTTSSTSTSTSATSTSASTTPASGDGIVIGLYGSLTGSTATFGKSSKNGVQMAFDEINAKGGVLKQQIKLVSEDDGSKTDQVPGVVNKLIAQSDVLALVGEVASSRSLAAAPIAQAKKVPMISPSSTNPKVTQVGDYIFRTCFIDPFQGTVMARFARKNLKATKAAILTDVANDYSKGLTEFFTKEWVKSGGKIVKTESYQERDTDFQTQLTSIKGANPDVIFIPGYYGEVGSIAVQARNLDMKQPLLGGDGWDSPKLYEIGGSALEGCYFSNHYSSQSKAPAVQKFVKAYEAKFGAKPDALAAVAYDAAGLVANAITRAGAADRAKLRDALANTKNFPGVTGSISIDKDRNAIKPAVILEIKGGKENYLTTVNP